MILMQTYHPRPLRDDEVPGMKFENPELLALMSDQWEDDFNENRIDNTTYAVFSHEYINRCYLLDDVTPLS